MKNKVIKYIILSTTCITGTFSCNAKRGILAHIPEDKPTTSTADPTKALPATKVTTSPTRTVVPSAPQTITHPAATETIHSAPVPPKPPTKSAPETKPHLETHKPNTKKKEGIVIPKMPKPPAKAADLSPGPLAPIKKDKLPSPKPPAKAVHESKNEKEAFAHAKKLEESEQKIRFYFEDATLENVVEYIKTLFNVTFLPDDAVKPLLSGAVPVEGHKVTFKTNRALSRQEAWNIFLRLLDLSGLTLVPGATKKFYRITSIANANQLSLPIYFGTASEKLPDNATKIRYVYFVKNNPLQTIQNVATALASSTAKIIPFTELDALIITDKASNIRSLMKIINEFDKTMPEAMSVLKLKKTDATKVAQLYASLTKSESPQGGGRFIAQRKQSASMYFPADARIIADPRTNSLILLGPKKDLAKIENFIVKHIDTELEAPYSPLYVYHLENTSASNISSILQKVISFGSSTTAGQVGGVRDGQKYFKAGSISIVPEPTNNSLIIKADPDDYAKLVETIKVLDVDQPQVAIEVLIVDVSATNAKSMAAQLRNKSEGSVINNTNFQSAQINTAQTNTTNGGLIANLVGLASGSNNPVGTTLLSVGSSAADGIWGLFRVLKTYTDAKIVSNPFLLATNKYQSSFTFGKTRRVIEATVGASNNSSFGDKTANLTLNVTPQINSEGVITMDIDLKIVDFTNESDTDAATSTKHITTSVHVKNQDVLVLGGITKNTVSTTVTKVPLLGDIPLFGTLFRGKSKDHIRSNLIIFLSPKIIAPTHNQRIGNYTHYKAENIKETLNSMNDAASTRDPLDKAFFESNHSVEKSYMDSFEQFMHPDIENVNNAHNKTKVKNGPIFKEKSPTPPLKRAPARRKRRRLARRKGAQT